MTANTSKPLLHLIGTAVATGTLAAGSLFAMDAMASGYMQADPPKAQAAEGKCGEGKCGGGMAKAADHEGKCGMTRMDTDKDGRLSRAEFAAAHKGSDEKFADHDGNGDGFITQAEMDAHHATMKKAKGADAKASGEGKCGEGKCGEGKCGGSA
jgi:uncharacterized low-complexity protein